MWWHAFQHFLGLDSASGTAYLAWSGVLSDISELALLGALLGLLRKHNCHSRGCLRIGRHRVPGTDFTCCARHTPGGAPTHAHILALHRHAVSGEAAERLYDSKRDDPAL